MNGWELTTLRRTEKLVNRNVDRMNCFVVSSGSHVDWICLRDFPAHSSRRGDSVTGTSERMTSVNGSSCGEISSNRDAIMVY